LKPRALVLDDEPLMREFLAETLNGCGFATESFEDPAQALKGWMLHDPEVAFLDLRLPGTSGVEVMREARERGSRAACVVLTAFGTVETAVAALKEGAEDYLLKPCPAAAIERAALQALKVGRLRHDNRRLRESARARGAAPELVGNDPAFRTLVEQLPTLARSRATVLLLGESGTGKELFARALHDQGPRSEGPWVSVNCAALPESLLENELFGHERGAFTGAHSRMAGRFEQAHGGTILLDEISEITPGLQSKLLRVLQEREFFRLGGVEPVRVDVRVVATSNRDLSGMVARGEFRADLFYRLHVITLRLPSLRQRAGDVALLAMNFLPRLSAEVGREIRGIQPEALEMLARHPWPGNVRELYHALERAAVFSRSPELAREDFDLDPAPAMRPAGLDLDVMEREAIEAALSSTGGHREKAARLLGISVRTLRNKLQRYREETAGVVQNLPPQAAENSPLSRLPFGAGLRQAA
jgi:DNA-binding NtrC family response regulator